MDEEMLKIAVAYKHDNILSSEEHEELNRRVIPLDDPSALNCFIINLYSYSSANVQFSLMAEFLTAIVEELHIRNNDFNHWWNVAETRSLVDFSIVHVFNKIVNILHDEGYIHADRYAKGVITEARLSKSKEAVIYRLEGS